MQIDRRTALTAAITVAAASALPVGAQTGSPAPQGLTFAPAPQPLPFDPAGVPGLSAKLVLPLHRA